MSMTDIATCPEIETLAALAEGVLEAPERDALMPHLDSCQNCYGLFAEIVATLEEERPPNVHQKPEEPPASVAASRHRPKRGRAVLVWAAPLVAAAAIFLVVIGSRPSAEAIYLAGMESAARSNGSFVVMYDSPRPLPDKTYQSAILNRGKSEPSPLRALLDAIDKLERRLERNPDHIESGLDLAMLYLAAGQHGRAYLTAAKFSSPEAECLQYLALFLDNDFQLEQQTWDKLHALTADQTSSAFVAYTAARMLELSGREDAGPLWERYLKLAPEGPRKDEVRENLE